MSSTAALQKQITSGKKIQPQDPRIRSKLLKRPDQNKNLGKGSTASQRAAYLQKYPKIAIDRLEYARDLYVVNTGGKLRDVKTAGAYKAMSESTQAKYRKRNPKEFPVKDVGSKLSTKSLLGKA